MWNIFFHFPVCTTFTFLLKINKSISMKHRLHENVTMLISLGHGHLKFITLKKVNDVHDADLDKRHR